MTAAAINGMVHQRAKVTPPRHFRNDYSPFAAGVTSATSLASEGAPCLRAVSAVVVSGSVHVYGERGRAGAGAGGQAVPVYTENGSVSILYHHSQALGYASWTR